MPHRSPHLPPTLPSLRDRGYDVLFLSHGEAILKGEFPEVLAELESTLSSLTLPITEIIGSGGGETRFTQRLRRALAALGWPKHTFVVAKTVDGVPRESVSHEVDHVRRTPQGVIALEIEWNNKDPFFDRDLENFKRLHAEGAISVGILITRGASLQQQLHAAVRRFAEQRAIDSFEDLAASGYVPTPKQKAAITRRVGRATKPIAFADAWTDNFVGNKYGQATTHWEKLMARVQRGVGNPCPLLLIGLPDSIIDFDTARVDVIEDGDAEEASPA